MSEQGICNNCLFNTGYRGENIFCTYKICLLNRNETCEKYTDRVPNPQLLSSNNLHNLGSHLRIQKQHEEILNDTNKRHKEIINESKEDRKLFKKYVYISIIVSSIAILISIIAFFKK